MWQHAKEEFQDLEELTTREEWVDEHRAFQLYSSYTITADRRINQQKYRCSIGGNPTVYAETKLEVKCEYSL